MDGLQCRPCLFTPSFQLFPSSRLASRSNKSQRPSREASERWQKWQRWHAHGLRVDIGHLTRGEVLEVRCSLLSRPKRAHGLGEWTGKPGSGPRLCSHFIYWDRNHAHHLLSTSGFSLNRSIAPQSSAQEEPSDEASDNQHRQHTLRNTHSPTLARTRHLSALAWLWRGGRGSMAVSST